MSEKLPIGWVKTTLGAITEPSRARALPAEVPDMRYVGLEHIEPQTMKLLGYGRARDIRSSSVRFSRGDVLYGKMRPYLNKVWISEFDGICSAEFLVFPKYDGLDNRFIAARLNAKDFVTFANGQVSGERPRVGFEKLSHFPILLPPIREQERIVAKLNATLKAVEQAETASRRAQERLSNYHHAVLNAAITGELTREWRKQNIHIKPPVQVHKNKKTRFDLDLPPTWSWLLSANAFSFITSGSRGWARYYSDKGALFIRVGNLKHNSVELDLKSIQRVAPPASAEGRRTRVAEGDILISVTADVGMVAVVKAGLEEAYINQHVALARPIGNMDTQYLAYFLSAKNGGQKQFLNLQRGATKVGLGLDDIRSIWIAYPPLAEQQEIVGEIERRLSAQRRLAAVLEQQLVRARETRQSLLHEAFVGKLVLQNSKDEPSSVLLGRICKARAAESEARVKFRAQKKKETVTMNQPVVTATALRAAWQKIAKKPDAGRLVEAAGFAPEQVVQFYELLRATPEIREAFEAASKAKSRNGKMTKVFVADEHKTKGHFRLVRLWLENFKNLKNYEVCFNPSHGLSVILGWNGTGKSNLFEALVIIFRDLNQWWEKNRWPDEPMSGYRLIYEIEEHLVEVVWNPAQMKRPTLKRSVIPKQKGKQPQFETVKRQDLSLPRFIFGYYSGPTNRLAEHFLPMKRDHYERLVKAKSDDPKTLAKLLEQRRFFCAETHHAKYVLLAFAYKEDQKITHFLEHRLRILGFESALFVIRRPRWARKGSTAKDFWGATGIMLRVMEKLRRFAIAPMVLEQTVSDGYRSSKEDHYFFFLPDLKSLHAFAAEYADARSFFVALESTDFSELIHDVKIQVRVKTADNRQIPITFRELSEGEQQLLMVLGLMRFTKSHQSLVLLDEPDTHLNPHWSVDFLKDLASVISDNNKPSPEQQTSQLLMATHDPLVIASLLKDQVHLLKRDRDSLQCYWQQASEDPRGLGFTGILISDMFGFRSDLDEETLALLDRQVQLAGKARKLSHVEKGELFKLNKQIDVMGFKTASSDPYYRAFIKALSRHQEVLALIQKPIQTSQERTSIRKVADEILVKLAKKHALKP